MQKTQFDLFISYSSSDRVIVHDVAGRLRATGLRVFLDVWEIPFFSRLVEQLEYGVQNCRACLIFYSEHSQQSPWVKQEYYTFVQRAIVDNSFLIGVVRLDSTELPPFLKGWMWRDLSQGREVDVDDLAETVARRLGVSEPVMVGVRNRRIWSSQAELSLKLLFTLASLGLEREKFKEIWRISDILKRGPNFLPRVKGPCECGGVTYCGYADMGSGPYYFDSYFHICDTCFKHKYASERVSSSADELPRCPWCDFEWKPRPVSFRVS